MITIGTIYQYDQNRTVSVTDDADEMHWQQVKSNTSLRTPIVNGIANIPNLILLTHGEVKCWAYNTTTDRTLSVYIFDIIKRQKPENYVYTETDAITAEQFIIDYLQDNPIGWNAVADKPTAFPPSDHQHDDRYYTETEIDTKLSDKSDADHAHDASGVAISDVGEYYNSTFTEGALQEIGAVLNVIASGLAGL